MSNIFEFLLDFVDVLVDMSVNIWEFLTTKREILGYEFTPIFVLGGATLITLIIIKLVQS